MAFKLDSFKSKIAKINNKYDSSLLCVIDIREEEVFTISSGIDAVDWVLCGGFRTKRIIELYGENSSGKTLVAMNALRDTQERGGLAVLIETEASLEIDFAEKMIGLNYDTMVHFRVGTLKDVYKHILMVQGLVLKEKPEDRPPFICIVVDSVAIGGDAIKDVKDDITMRMMLAAPAIHSQYLPYVAAKTTESNTCLIAINQLREDINSNVNPNIPAKFQKKVIKTTGGRTLKFWASTRLLLSKGSLLKDSKFNEIGFMGGLYCEKNKATIGAGRKASLKMLYGRGFVKEEGMLTLFLEHGLIKKKGKFFEVETTNLDSEPKVVKYLSENRDVYTRLRDNLYTLEPADIFEEEAEDIVEDF